VVVFVDVCMVFFVLGHLPLFLLLNTMIHSSPACSRKKRVGRVGGPVWLATQLHHRVASGMWDFGGNCPLCPWNVALMVLTYKSIFSIIFS
jgi:hypothetical protein